MAVALLGGAFDPPHDGHVALARAALEQLDVGGLLVLVVAHPGHKGVAAPAVARLELTRLAFAPIAEATVQLDEHARTVDSLEGLRLRDAYFVIGSDELAGFWSWKQPERVLELVHLAVGTRPGASERDLEAALGRIPRDRVRLFHMPEMPISSTDIRRRVARGEDISAVVPSAVVAAIARLGLYTAAE